MFVSKIITHGGRHHADEVLSCALLMRALDLKESAIERVFKVEQKHLDDLRCAVVDVGGEFEPKKWNLDHHQDEELSASNILVLHALFENMLVDKYEFDAMASMFKVVSMVDIGKVSALPDSFTSMIRRTSDFSSALKLALLVVDGMLNQADQLRVNDSNWKKYKINGKWAIAPINCFVSDWRARGINYLVTPGRENFHSDIDGDWNIMSRDSDILPIPFKVGENGVTFVHNGKFMCVVKGMNNATRLVKTLV